MIVGHLGRTSATGQTLGTHECPSTVLPATWRKECWGDPPCHVEDGMLGRSSLPRGGWNAGESTATELPLVVVGDKIISIHTLHPPPPPSDGEAAMKQGPRV